MITTAVPLNSGSVLDTRLVKPRLPSQDHMYQSTRED